MTSRLRVTPFLPLAALVLLGACAATQRFLADVFRERAPAPLDRMVTASDARIDSLGRIAGSFVGEGTERAVHLISSDSVFVRSLVEAYVPNIRRTSDFWSGVRARGVVRVPLREPEDAADTGVLAAPARTGSPAGRSDVLVTAITVRAGRCGGRGSRAELIVEPLDRDAPALTGPVVGSVDETLGRGTPLWRAPLPAPSRVLTRELISRTRRVMDSLLADAWPAVHAGAPIVPDPEVNTLADVDAADVIAYHAADTTVRYAVSLRERRVAGTDTLVSAGVMGWNEDGSWQQVIFQPTWLRLRRNSIRPFAAARPLYWRRLSAVTDFSFERDNLWMEQVNVSDGSVIWGIVQPADNVVVAAAEMDGPCQ
jgi:hypothetical protein